MMVWETSITDNKDQNNIKRNQAHYLSIHKAIYDMTLIFFILLKYSMS